MSKEELKVNSDDQFSFEEDSCDECVSGLDNDAEFVCKVCLIQLCTKHKSAHLEVIIYACP